MKNFLLIWMLKILSGVNIKYKMENNKYEAAMLGFVIGFVGFVITVVVTIIFDL